MKPWQIKEKQAIERNLEQVRLLRRRLDAAMRLRSLDNYIERYNGFSVFHGETFMADTRLFERVNPA
jgi:hypothetical protein